MAGRSGVIYLGDSIADGGYEISYDMEGLNGFCTIGDEFTVGTDAARVAAAAAKYTYFIPWAKCTLGPGGATRVATPGAPQWTDAEVLSLYSVVAAAHDAQWKTGAAVDQGWVTNAAPLSRATIIWPQGSFAVNFPIMTCYGSYLGWGSSQFANETNDANQTTYGTRLFIDHDNWIDNAAPERYIFRSVNFIEEVGGTLYGGINGDVAYNNYLAIYLEGCRIEGFRLDGMKDSETYDTGLHCSGIAMLRLGSGSYVHRNQCDNFNTCGIELVGGTPATLNTNRTFFNNLCGVWIRGEAKVFVTSHEADENPTVFLVTDYSTATNSGLIEAGCVLGVNGMKMEAGTQGDAKRKGQMMLDAEGWVCATFTTVDFVGINCFVECMVRIQPTSNESSVTVIGFRVFGFVRTLVHHADGTDSRKWFMPLGQYTKKWNSAISNFFYNSYDGGQLTTIGGQAPRMIDINYANRQLWLGESAGAPVGTWTDTGTTGLPDYTF